MPTAREYDSLAWFYDRFWGGRFHDAARPALERLLYSRLGAGDRILELCCGSGHLTQELVSRGYRVVGVDSSIGMLRHARRRAPAASLVCADAARFSLAGADCAAAVSTFDSINHLLTRDALEGAFRSTAAALREGGLFVFDVNTEEAYRSEWGKSSAVAEADAAIFVRGGYDAESLVGRTSITMFRLADGWQRSDVDLAQRSYDPGELAGVLREHGFDEVAVTAAAAAGMAGDIAVGRVFVTATKRLNPEVTQPTEIE